MRAASRGTYYEDIIICGFPCSTWISLMEETYSITAYGYQFNGWPDGKPTVEQESCVIDILKIVLAEYIRDIKDGQA